MPVSEAVIAKVDQMFDILPQEGKDFFVKEDEATIKEAISIVVGRRRSKSAEDKVITLVGKAEVSNWDELSVLSKTVDPSAFYNSLIKWWEAFNTQDANGMFVYGTVALLAARRTSGIPDVAEPVPEPDTKGEE